MLFKKERGGKEIVDRLWKKRVSPGAEGDKRPVDDAGPPALNQEKRGGRGMDFNGVDGSL